MIKKIPNITIEAVIDPGTKNKKEDWTGLEEKTFCLNNEAEKFDQIELVIASKSRQLPLFSALYIEADAKGCREADLTVTYNIDNTQVTSSEEKTTDTVVTHKEERHEKTSALFLYKLERTGNENLKGYGLVREERYKRQSIESFSGTGNWEKVDEFRNRSAGSVTSLEYKFSGILKTIREPEYLSIYYDPKTDRPLKVDFVMNPPIDGDFDWEGEYRQVETRRSGTKTSSRKEEIKQLPRLRPFPILESEIEKGKKVESWDKQGNRFSGVFRWDTTAANVTHFKGSASWEMVRKRQ
jgi:hypothetical protein